MKNDNESIQEIIDSMSVGKRKYEEKKSLKKGFKSIEDYILHGLNILNKPSNIKETNILIESFKPAKVPLTPSLAIMVVPLILLNEQNCFSSSLRRAGSLIFLN